MNALISPTELFRSIARPMWVCWIVLACVPAFASPPSNAPAAARHEATIEEDAGSKARVQKAPGEGQAIVGADGTRSRPPLLSRTERGRRSPTPTLRLGFERDRAPYSYLNAQGSFDGLAADYVAALERTLDLDFELVPADDWNQLQEMVQAGRVDMVAAAVPGDFGASQMVFSRPYERFPEVIVARATSPAIIGPEDLSGRRIATRKEAALLREMGSAFPDSVLVPVESNDAGLAMLDRGEVDAYIGTLPAIDALIRDRYATRLRVVAPTGLDKELSIGIDRRYAYLLPEINRALARIDEVQGQEIRRRWLTAEYQYGMPWKWVLGLVLPGLTMIVLLGLAYLRTRREVHARTTAEQTLARQLEFQRVLLDTIPYPIFVKDGDGRYLAVNPAYESRFEVDAAKLIGKTKWETGHIPLVHLEQVDDLEVAAMRSEHVLSREVRTVSAETGRVRHDLLWMKRFDIGDGEVRLLGAGVDVTSMKEVEARARLSEERLAEITGTLPAAVFQIRHTRSGERIFTYIAGDTLGTIGLTPEQILLDESLAFSRIHPEDRARTLSILAESIEMLVPAPQFEVRMETNQGQRWIQTAGGVPRRNADGDVEWSGYWIDVTRAHKQADALREANRKAEAAVAAKGAFLAMMSHEIRTPMAEVIGLLEMAVEDAHDDTQAGTLRLVQESATSLLQILDDILDFSRIESGRLELDPRPFDLRYVVDSVVGLFVAKATEKGVKLSSTIDWRVQPAYRGDAARIRQVVTNLLSNALKFTQHGSVDITVECTGLQSGEDRISISVHDTGIGISAEQLGHLFEPFSQADVSTSRQYGGTGLGLTISRRIARLMGGDVSLHSILGQGTTATFDFTLPACPGPHTLPQFDGKLAFVGARDAVSAREVGGALRALGFAIAEEAAVKQAACQPDLWLVDECSASDWSIPEGTPVVLLQPRTGDRGHGVEAGRTLLYTRPLQHHCVGEACAVAMQVERDPARGSEPARQDLRTSDARILVAEDQSISRTMIGRQLERLGFRCTLVGNGEEAWEALASARYDLLLTDCQMPVLDGYRLAARIRQAETGATPRLRIIALSAAALPDQVQRCREAGMDDFIAKPVRIARLAEVLADHLGRDTAQVREEHAEPDSSGLPPAARHLASLFGGVGQACTALADWLSTAPREMAALQEMIEAGDSGGQDELLHRMNGVIVMLRGNAVTPPSHGSDMAVRQGFVVDQVGELASVLALMRASMRA